MINPAMQSSGDTNWFKITLTAGVTYDFTESGLDGVFFEVSPAASASDVSQLVEPLPSPAGSQTINYTADITGDYYVEIYSYYGQVGSYTLNAAIVPNSYTLVNPGTLSVGSVTSATMQSAGDTDWFEINLTAGVTYDFTQSGLTSAEFQVLPVGSANANDVSETVRAESHSSTTQTFNYTADATGAYYVELNDITGGVESYTLSAAIVPNSYTLANPGMLSVGSTTTATMQSVGDANWFKITLTAGVTYDFTESGMFYPTFFVAPAASASDFALSVGGASYENGTETINYTADATGDYYVELNEFSGHVGSYTLSAAIVPNSYTLANPGTLSVGSATMATMQSAGDTNWFAVNLTAGVTYDFTESGLSNGEFDVLPLARASDYAEPVDTVTISPNTQTINYTADATGAYYVEFYDFFGNVGSYTLNAAIVPNSYTLANPGTLSVGSGANATIESTADTNWFKINLTAGVTYDFTESGLSQARLEVLPAATAMDLSSPVGTGRRVNNTETVNYTADATGAYYVEINDSIESGVSYTLNAAVVPNSYTLANPGTLSVTGFVPSSDVNGDDMSDIAFQSTDGSVAVWEMNGSSIIANGAAVLGDPGTTWKTIGAGDFYGDGMADILLQQTSGNLAYWGVASGDGGPTLDAPHTLELSLDPGPTWAAVATGDVNGDGVSDIVFQNINSGAVAAWEMFGSSLIVNATTVGAAVLADPGTAWHVRATGDFYDNGADEILLQNDNGSLAIWGVQTSFNGSTLEMSETVAFAAALDPGPSWVVRGVGDVNGDGHSDIVLQNAQTGDVAIWEMNGASLLSPTSAAVIASPGADWSVKAVGDYNGDGMSDILLQKSQSGALAMWFMNGLNLEPTSAALAANPGTSWSPVG